MLGGGEPENTGWWRDASLKSWKRDGSVTHLDPAHCCSSSACAPDPMGTWRTLQREGAAMPQAEDPCCCKNERRCSTQRAPFSSTRRSCCATSTSLVTVGQTLPPSQPYPTASWEQDFPVPFPSWACRKTFPAVPLSCWQQLQLIPLCSCDIFPLAAAELWKGEVKRSWVAFIYLFRGLN